MCNSQETEAPVPTANAAEEPIITEQELSECDRDQIQFIGTIQGDSGNFLTFTYPDGVIECCDAKILDVPWIQSPTDEGETNKKGLILAAKLSACIPESLYKEIDELVLDMKRNVSQRAFHFYKHDSVCYALSLSCCDHDFGTIGIEIETSAETDSPENFFTTITGLGRVMESYAQTKQTVTVTACDAVFKILEQYDRGMIYRFNDDLSGEVIHEIMSERIETSYIGMRFPSTDIPLPARKLYVKNGLRYIHDVDGTPVDVISKDGTQTDLSQCRMRAVAKPHIVYLRNMGVKCSLSLAIVVENQLWGLLAFHGYTKAFKPTLQQRIACETIVSMLSVRIESLVKKQESARVMELSNHMISLKADQSVIHNLHDWGEGILKVLDADIVVGHVYDPHDIERDGIVIGDQSLQPALSFWDKMKDVPNRELVVMSNRKETGARGLTVEECPPAGVVFFREGRVHIMIGRAVRSKDVRWAGNPDEPKLRIGGILSPRNSFDTFMQKAKKEARQWSVQDTNVIKVMRDRICEHAHNYMLTLLQTSIEDSNQRYMDALSRARDNYEFFAHMSHELRTPFHGVMGCLNILHDSIRQLAVEEQTELTNTALASGNHMMNLLNDILNISKSKHLSHEMAKDKVIFQSFAFEAVDGMRSLAQSKGIRMNCTITPKDRTDLIVTDKTKIIQIVSNTVNNAIKFNGDGDVVVKFSLFSGMKGALEACVDASKSHTAHVWIGGEEETLEDMQEVLDKASTCPSSSSENVLYFSVEDTGCGMSQTEIVEMFAPYKQACGGSNRMFQGTGLGLFITMTLVQQQGGFVAAASTVDQGTIFCIGVPVALATDGDKEEEDTAESMEGMRPIPMASNLVMIVDDNAVNVKILKRAMEMQVKKQDSTVNIITASGGEEAFSLYVEKRPSLCIIDYHMPEVDGVECCKKIRAYEAEHGLRQSYVMSYTADATEKASKAILSSGANEIMNKPPPKGFIEALVRRMQSED